MSSQRFIFSYLPSIINLVIGLMFIIVAHLRLRRHGDALRPEKVRALKRVRIIGFVMVGLALLMLAGESLFGAG